VMIRLGDGVEGEPVAEGFELSDVVAFGAVGAQAGGVEVGTEVTRPMLALSASIRSSIWESLRSTPCGDWSIGQWSDHRFTVG